MNSFTNKSTKLLAFLLFAGLNLSYLHAQQNDSAYHSYSGVVVDKNTGEKLPYAHLAVSSKNISTVANSAGEFIIKIPDNPADEWLETTFVGYQTVKISVRSLKEKNNRIELKQLPFLLPQIDVMPKEARELVAMMLEKIKDNYSREDMLMRAFYRETIKKRSAYVSISEAVIDVYKQGYQSRVADKIALLKSRRSADYHKLDTLVFKLMGGPFNTLYQDVVKYPEYFFDRENINSYLFQYLNNTRIDDRLIYIVYFKQYIDGSAPVLYGNLYIDAKTFALVRAEFDMDLSDPEAAAILFIRKKPFNAKVFATKAHYRVDYQLHDNKWRYAYSRAELSLKINWKRKLFNTVYNTVIEMAATEWKEKVDRNDFTYAKLLKPTVILQDKASGFSDPDFWGSNNIIEPEKSIENAINKIQKQLKKANK